MPCSPLEVTGPLHTSLPAHWCVPGISPVVTSRCAWCAFSNAVCGECAEVARRIKGGNEKEGDRSSQ